MAPLCLSRRTERLGIHLVSNEGEGFSRKRRTERTLEREYGHPRPPENLSREWPPPTPPEERKGKRMCTPRLSRRRERMATLCLSRRKEQLGVHPFSNEGEGLSRKRREKRRDARARRLPPLCLLRKERGEGHPFLR